MAIRVKRGCQYTTRWISALDDVMDGLDFARGRLVDNEAGEALAGLETAKSGIERLLGDIARELKAEEEMDEV